MVSISIVNLWVYSLYFPLNDYLTATVTTKKKRSSETFLTIQRTGNADKVRFVSTRSNYSIMRLLKRHRQSDNGCSSNSLASKVTINFCLLFYLKGEKKIKKNINSHWNKTLSVLRNNAMFTHSIIYAELSKTLFIFLLIIYLDIYQWCIYYFYCFFFLLYSSLELL